MDMEQRVCRWVDENSGEAIEFLRDMIKIPSVNTWFEEQEEFRGEGAAQELIRKKMLQLGAEVELTYADAKKLAKYEGQPGYSSTHTFEDRPNLYAEIKGTGGGKSILLTGHIDTVATGSGWSADPFGAEIRDGKIYGRGAVDMKGGIAAMIMAAEAVVKSGIALKGDIRVGTIVDEESGGMGMLAFIDQGYRADACIMTEATDSHVAPLCRGILWGKIIVNGRSGHIELPHGDWRNGEAVDTIKKARMILDMIDHLNEDWRYHKVHPLLKIPCQIEVGQVIAGEFPSTFANKAEIYFDAQFLPSERDAFGGGQLVMQEIEEFIAAVAQTDPWLRENPPVVEWITNADCAETPSDHEFVETCLEALQEVGREPVLEGCYFHTDMGWPERAGIPIVNFGAGDPRKAHQNDEYIPVEEYLDSIKMMAVTILKWCGAE